jgi:hypothetical protein
MHRALAENLFGCVIEVHGCSLEERAAMSQRLFKVLVACGCCAVRFKRFGARALEYSFEVDLAAVLDLYCGLAQAGLEMTEVSHRALTELCVLRSHERVLLGTRCLTPRVVNVRVMMSFFDPEEIAVPGVIAASA